MLGIATCPARRARSPSPRHDEAARYAEIYLVISSATSEFPKTPQKGRRLCERTDEEYAYREGKYHEQPDARHLIGVGT